MKTYLLKISVRALLGMLIVIITLASCKKEEEAPEIPYVYVNFSLDPNGTQYINLNAVNGWETVTGGYNGILIFRRSINEFVAFERACPYHPTASGAQVRVDTSQITCYCPVCNSKYILYDGTPFEGVSRYPLKQYTTVYDGYILHISN